MLSYAIPPDQKKINASLKTPNVIELKIEFVKKSIGNNISLSVFAHVPYPHVILQKHSNARFRDFGGSIHFLLWE